MKRRVLLVDDEVAVLLTIKAVLEINDYSVDTATSAREGRNRIRTRTYDMIITDMRMESDASGLEVIRAARTATYQPAVALLTGFPVDEDDWEKMGDVQLLVKATGTQKLLNDLKMLLERRDARIAAETNVVVVPALAAKAESKGDKSAARKANAAAEPEPSKRKAAGAAKSTTTAASASGKRNITT
jgi:DNA-binding response OmpR family regulator